MMSKIHVTYEFIYVTKMYKVSKIFMYKRFQMSRTLQNITKVNKSSILQRIKESVVMYKLLEMSS